MVMATYNEAETIGPLLNALLPYPVIVVDDSSPDGTGTIAYKLGATVLTRPQKSGIASAYYGGFIEALKRHPRYIVQMDAGFTHCPKDVPRLIKKISQGYGLVIGSRFLRPVKLTKRSLISKVAALMMRVAGIKAKDATSGFRCWEPWVLSEVVEQSFEAHDFAFQLEALYRAKKTGARITEIPIEYRLTNSSFRPAMLVEALKIYTAILRETL